VGSILPPISPLAPELQPIPYDPAGAKALLAEAGWTDSNRDGVLDQAGRPLRFTILTNAANQLLQDIATVVQEQLKAAGVDAQIRTLEFQTLLQQHRARDYEAVLSNWGWDYFRPDPTPLFSCAEAERPSSPNRAGYCNPRADQLMEAGLRELDAARARTSWGQYSQILQQDQPITPLYWNVDLTATGPTLQGVTTDARGQLVSVSRWWIGR
jgi:peptide/nickel transport system substrate-binding protein